MADRTRPTKHETSEPRATIHLSIEQDKAAGKTLYVATTPHVPHLRGEDPDQPHRAVNRLLDAVRAHRKPYEAKGEPVPWSDATPGNPPGEDTQVLRLTGVCPPKTVAPRATGAPNKPAKAGGE